MPDGGATHLEFLAARGLLEHLAACLRRPGQGLCTCASAVEFERSYLRIRAGCAEWPGLCRLLDLNLLAQSLLLGPDAPEWLSPWIDEHLPLQNLLSEPVRLSRSLGRWSAVPVLLVFGEAYLMYFVAGCLPDAADGPLVPDWAAGVMDEAALSAVSAAAQAARKALGLNTGVGLFCFPLVEPGGQVQLRGGSLGLPLALGFCGLLAGADWPQGLAATGALDPAGTVLPAAHLEEKAGLAAGEGFKVFLCPGSKGWSGPMQGIEILPIADLDEADMFRALHSPGRAGDLLLLRDMLGDPDKFVRNCTRFTREWVDWCLRTGKVREVVRRVSASTEHFKAFVAQFERCVTGWDLAAAGNLTRLAAGEKIPADESASPLSAFRWYTLNMALSNHSGDVSKADGWRRRAETLVERAGTADVEAFAAFHNHRYVDLHHNRYHFEPDLPEDLGGIRRVLEEQYRAQLTLGCTAYRPLGELYGTMAQNYGFCGPGYLSETLRYAALAREAFGGGKVPEFEEDCRRQLHYTVYALLDAGRLEEAGQSAVQYLGLPGWSGLESRLDDLSSWEHALLARFLADAGLAELAPFYRPWATARRRSLVKPEHPWQLWLFNLGRIAVAAGERTEAADLFRESLHLCLSKHFGPTVKVMALLPLIGLHDIGALQGAELAGAEKRVREAAAMLNLQHFKAIEQPDFGRVLEEVQRGRDRLFPFSYR